MDTNKDLDKSHDCESNPQMGWPEAIAYSIPYICLTLVILAFFLVCSAT
jgi:hypothetical protein